MDRVVAKEQRHRSSGTNRTVSDLLGMETEGVDAAKCFASVSEEFESEGVSHTGKFIGKRF